MSCFSVSGVIRVRLQQKALGFVIFVTVPNQLDYSAVLVTVDVQLLQLVVVLIATGTTQVLCEHFQKLPLTDHHIKNKRKTYLF